MRPIRSRLSLPLFLGGVLLAAPAAAQEDVPPNEVVFRELTDDDPVDDQGRHYDAWQFPAVAGQTYVITLVSSDFDSYLQVGPADGDNCRPCESDDDSGGDRDAMIFFEPTDDGMHVVRVTSFEAGSTGGYSFLVEGGMDEVIGTDTLGFAIDTVMADPGVARDLYANAPAEGIVVPGMLNAYGEPFERWKYLGAAGETITVTMASDEFDTLLRIWMPTPDGGLVELGYDDDGNAGTNSALTVTLPDQLYYEIHAAGFDPDETGSYSIFLASDGSIPVDTVGGLFLVPGEEVSGTLTEDDPVNAEGVYEDVWYFSGEPGETYVITLRSDAFDAYLLAAPVGDDCATDACVEDDDGGGGTDAQLVYRVKDGGEQEIHVRSFSPDETGPYQLSVQRR